MHPEERISRAIDGLKIKENELYDVSFTLEFLSWVARLVEEAKNADPDEKTDLSHLSGKVVDGLDWVFDLLHTHTAWMAEDLSGIFMSLRKPSRNSRATVKVKMVKKPELPKATNLVRYKSRGPK